MFDIPIIAGIFGANPFMIVFKRERFDTPHGIDIDPLSRKTYEFFFLEYRELCPKGLFGIVSRYNQLIYAPCRNIVVRKKTKQHHASQPHNKNSKGYPGENRPIHHTRVSFHRKPLQ
jgi:hypothetical protein